MGVHFGFIISFLYGIRLHTTTDKAGTQISEGVGVRVTVGVIIGA